jgi:hypothetical protein
MKVIMCKESGCDKHYILGPDDYLAAIHTFIDVSNLGDELILKLVDLTQEEIDNLTEFDGC